jgi:hypothetical protein
MRCPQIKIVNSVNDVLPIVPAGISFDMVSVIVTDVIADAFGLRAASVEQSLDYGS